MIVLVSGGLDSLAAWRLLGLPRAVRFEIGTVSSRREWEAIRWAEGEWDGWVERRPRVAMNHAERTNGYLPHRNAILVALAAQLDPHVVVPMIAEWAPDKSPRFFRRLARVLSGQGDFQGVHGRVRIDTPFARVTKAELLLRYEDAFGADDMMALLRNSWSCYHAGARHCGACSGCVQRHVAEITVGARATRYEQRPDARGFYRRPSVSDVARAARDGCGLSLFRRAREARAVMKWESWLRNAEAASPAPAPAAIGGAGHPSMRHAMRQARRLASRALEALLPSATPAVEQERTDGRPD